MTLTPNTLEDFLDSADGAGSVLAPYSDSTDLASEVAALRARGEIVMSALPGHEGTWKEAGCDRQLVKRGDRWAVVSLQGE